MLIKNNYNYIYKVLSYKKKYKLKNILGMDLHFILQK